MRGHAGGRSSRPPASEARGVQRWPERFGGVRAPPQRRGSSGALPPPTAVIAGAAACTGALQLRESVAVRDGGGGVVAAVHGRAPPRGRAAHDDCMRQHAG